MSGHILDPIETAIVELLGTAGLIEPDDLHLHRVEKVGDGWVIEGEMTVFANPSTDDVGGFGQKLVLVTQAGLERLIATLAGDQTHPALIQPNQPEQVLLQITAKRGRVVRRQTQVFIHVEADHA